MIAASDQEFLALLAECTRHAAEKHQPQFVQVSAVAGQVIASLTLELFETQQQEVAAAAINLRLVTCQAVERSRYSEIKGTFEMDPVTGDETEYTQ